MTKLFETTDPRGVKVYLDEDQWDYHISLPAGHLPRVCKHRAEQDHQDIHHRFGNLYAPHTHRQHLRDELRYHA